MTEKKKAKGQPKRQIVPVTPEQMEEIAGRLSVDQCAKYFGMSYNTMIDRLREDQVLLDAYNRGRASTIDKVATGLLQKALNGDLQAQIFFLKTQGRWKETNTVEHTGLDGEAMNLNVNVKFRE